MARLPIVELKHRRTGEKLIMNQTDYALNPGGYRDWKIISVRGGDATDEQVLFDAQQAEIERFRKSDPAREARFGDKKRAYRERAQIGNVVTKNKGRRRKKK